MSAFLPEAFHGATPEPDHPRLQQQPGARAEQRARWEVRAAQWRARELAEAVFGRVGRTAVMGMRPEGAVRGMMELAIPLGTLEAHREREVLFMALAARDPILDRPTTNDH